MTCGFDFPYKEDVASSNLAAPTQESRSDPSRITSSEGIFHMVERQESGTPREIYEAAKARWLAEPDGSYAGLHGILVGVIADRRPELLLEAAGYADRFGSVARIVEEGVGRETMQEDAVRAIRAAAEENR